MKWTIHKKVLLLVLGTGLATFVVLGIFSYLGKNVVKRDMEKMSAELGAAGVNYTDELLTEHLKITLEVLAEAKAQYIDREMSIMRDDAEMLSGAMTEIMSHPENFSPRSLPDPRNSNVKNGKSYLIFAPDIRDNVTPELQDEIAIAANIQDYLDDIVKSYSAYNCTAFAGSVKGWYICSRVVLGTDGKAHFDQDQPFSHERIYEFDPRRRPWYTKAAEKKIPVITDLYMTIEEHGVQSYQKIGASAPFFDASGNLAGVVGLDYSSEDIYNWINKSEIGKAGQNFVLNRKGEIVFASKDLDLTGFSGDLRENPERTVAAVAKKMVAGEEGIFSVTIDDENFYVACASIPSVGWSFGMIVSEEEILSATKGTGDYFFERINGIQDEISRKYLGMNNFIFFISVTLLIVLFLMSTNLSRKFVEPINELSDGVREIASGDLDKKLEIHTGDEIEHLAICFNAMTDELKAYMNNLTKVTAEKERIATELDVAKEIQSGMLPKDFPTRDDFEIFATMTPAKEVGGDFYDFYFLDETHVAITVADVSGKGIPAALFMVIAKTVLNNFAVSFYQRNGLAPVIEAANEKLCANNDVMMFVTAFVGVLDLKTGEFTFVNAGHNPPVIYRAEENRCEFLDVKKNFVLGPMDGIPFVEQKISFKRGDLLFVYTDGVTEALNVANEEYLPDRLINFMNSTDCRVDLQTLLKKIREDVSEHVGEAEQSDDITLFAFRFKGSRIDTGN